MVNMKMDSTEARAQDSQTTAATLTGAENQNAATLDGLGDDPSSWMNAALNFQEQTATSESFANYSAGETPQESNQRDSEVVTQNSANEEPDEAFDAQFGESDEVYRQRVRTSDPMLAEVLKLQKENPDKAFFELEAQARMNLANYAGIQLNMPNVENQPIVQNQGDPNAPQSLEELETRLDELMEAKIKAQTEDYDVAEAGRIEKEIYNLQKLEKGLRQRQEREIEAYYEQEQRQVNEASTKAETYYPDSAVEGSELHQEMIRVHEALKNTGDDRVLEPDYVWQLAKMAAKNKNVSPVDPSSQSSQRKPEKAQFVAQNQSRAPIASGSARSDTAPPPQADPLRGVANASDYYNAMEALRTGQLTAR